MTRKKIQGQAVASPVMGPVMRRSRSRSWVGPVRRFGFSVARVGWGRRLIEDGGEFKIDQAEAAIAWPVGDVAQVRVIVAHAIFL